jgi:hypothetical protein
MVKTCCYGLCNSDTRKDRTIRFLPFPKPKINLSRAKRWIHLCGRNDFTVDNITSRSYICTKHFPDQENFDLMSNSELEPFPAHSEELCRQKYEKRRKNRRPLVDLPLVDLNETETETRNLASSSQKDFLKNCYTRTRYLPIIPPSPTKLDTSKISFRGKYQFRSNFNSLSSKN